MAQRFRRTSHGVEARLDQGEAELLAGLVAQVAELLGQDPAAGDPVLGRLFPDGYRDDPEASAELRSLTHDDLRAGKLAALEAITTALAERDRRGRLVLAEEAAYRWLFGLNDLRLTLGTRLGVTEEMYDVDVVGPDGVEAQLLEVYAWLSWLQESLVEALSETLGETRSETR